ncbi:hypothetical protein [Luteipulveratus halotolerans]|uniref:hypothetical protein n=1 Tax=Luteipulveratus halotolerans TaxID=1631356 RepID=UPI00067FF304|nr:hypothetical protein [Luteipulveratus halotolerans]
MHSNRALSNLLALLLAAGALTGLTPAASAAGRAPAGLITGAGCPKGFVCKCDKSHCDIVGVVSGGGGSPKQADPPRRPAPGGGIKARPVSGPPATGGSGDAGSGGTPPKASPPRYGEPGGPGWMDPGGCDEQLLEVCDANPLVPAPPAAPARPTQPAPAPPPPPTPAQWSQAIQTTLKLPKPVIGSAPCHDAGCLGAVGLPVWLWTQPMPDQSVNVTLAGQTIRATAHLDRTVWTMGDGQTVTCAGTNATGTAYSTVAGVAASPTCGYRYTRQGDYTLSTQAQWTITWSGAATGTDQLASSATAPIAIGEYQAVTR